MCGIATLVLAACGPATETPPPVPPAEEAPLAPAAPGPPAAPAPEATAPEAAATESTAAPSAAETHCLAAVAEQTGVDGVTVSRVDRSEAGLSVMVLVPGAEAPWACTVDTDGETVVNVSYTGDEGTL